ncbi:hypothetical protein MNBD_ALPHA03-2008 [hydrothermal vent metagenome]|uniref:Uncharacterized protein n=1 Tax=hydrothermal vent metagenome TaxID=652676 RepID=A0A3B1ALL3_9ZZZZ
MPENPIARNEVKLLIVEKGANPFSTDPFSRSTARMSKWDSSRNCLRLTNNTDAPHRAWNLRLPELGKIFGKPTIKGVKNAMPKLQHGRNGQGNRAYGTPER